MIKLNNIQEKKCSFYFENTFLFEVFNVVNFYDCLLQIKKEKSRKYWILFESKIINIDQNGTLENYPIGLFDKYGDILCEIVVFNDSNQAVP